MKETVYLDIKGMHCTKCPTKVERSLSKLNGIHEVKVDYETEKGCVIFDNQSVNIQEIKSRISKMGFEAEQVEPTKHSR